MKNADDMLRGIIQMVDTSGDGKIQYEGQCFWLAADARGQDKEKLFADSMSYL